MTVVACAVPKTSLLDRASVDAAWFRDSYCAPSRHADASMVEIFFAIFGHHPAWMKTALITRNRIAAACGLETPTAASIRDPEIRSHYAVGDTIGPWPIFALTETEIIAGRDNHHLDFRLSILRGADASITVSTICTVHHIGGKLYLLAIIPFHKWGVRRLIVNAVTAGRL